MLLSGGKLVVRLRWRKNGNVSASAAANSITTRATGDRAQRSHKGAAARCNLNSSLRRSSLSA